LINASVLLYFREIVPKHFPLILAAIALWAFPAAAQDAVQVAPSFATIRGHVIEAVTGTPLAAVLVQVESTGQRVISDETGRFTIEKVPLGPQTLLVSAIGFGLVRRDVIATAGEDAFVTLTVSGGASTYVEDVSVTASRFRETQPAVASQAVLGSRELLALRGVIADDPFRAVQVLPGVAAGDDYRADFAVRGLGPYHVGLAIDDVDSRLLFHTVRGVRDTGSLALINSDILEEATLLSGAHPQKLGSHLGARLDFRTRDGARDRLHVRALVSGSATTGVVEGPLGDGSRGSWLLAARKSYIDWILRRVDTSIDGTFGFTDAQGKLTLTLTPAQTLRVSMIGGRSELDEDDQPGLNSFDRGRSHSVIGNVQWRLARSAAWALTQQIYFVDSRYRNRVSDGRSREEGGDRDVTWRSGIELSPSTQHFLEIGVQAQALQADRIDRRFITATASQIVQDQHPKTSTRAVWMSYRWAPRSAIVVSPGVRVEHWNQQRRTAASPWLLAEWQPRAATRIRGGISVQRQAPGFDESLLQRATEPLQVERARIADVGVEQQIGDGWRVLGTVFHRDEAERLALFGDQFRLVNGRIVRPTGPYLANTLDGRAHGVEFTLERRAVNGVFGWLSYAWGKATSTNRRTGETYWGDYDQRHTLNATIAYRWSERTSLSARYRFGSNFPIAGYFAAEGDTHMVATERNVLRLPRYSRFDARADRSFTFRRSRLTLFAEVVNVFNRANYRAQSASLDVSTGQIFGLTEKLFPLLPSAGILIEF
jgi:hypothetical protein